MAGPWGQTYSLKVYEYDAPDPASIRISDIAHALALINRFYGHTFRPISVAEHSLGVASMVPPKHRLGALFHDAGEAYVGDMAAPLKSLCPEFQRYERIAQEAIAKRFGFDVEILEAPEIRQADLDALTTERDVLKGGSAKSWGVPGRYNQDYALALKNHESDDWTYWKTLWAKEARWELAKKRLL